MKENYAFYVSKEEFTRLGVLIRKNGKTTYYRVPKGKDTTILELHRRYLGILISNKDRKEISKVINEVKNICVEVDVEDILDLEVKTFIDTSD